jgi:F-type H+-transporting ATPase subunit delta
MATKKSTYDISSRYASAYLSLIAKADFDKADQELAQIESWLSESKDFQSLITSNAVKRDDQKKVVLALADKAEFSKPTRHLLGLLAQNRRLAILPDLLAHARARIISLKGETMAHVTSAIALSDAQTQKLTTQLSDHFKTNIKIVQKIDPSLIGGLTIQVGSTLIDHSIVSKLDRLERELSSPNPALSLHPSTSKRGVA